MVLTKEAQEVAGALKCVSAAVEEGRVPPHLIHRFIAEPWKLLEPGEVLDMQRGVLLPKDLDLDSVWIGVQGHVTGLIKNGYVLGDGAVLSMAKKAKASNPFFSAGMFDFVEYEDGSADYLDGRNVAVKLLSRSPLITYRRGMVSGPFARSYPFPEAPAGATFQQDTLCVWQENGTVTLINVGNGAKWVASFPAIPGWHVKWAVAKAEPKGIAAIVFAWPYGDVTYKLVVLRHGRLVTQSTESHGWISQPLIADDGTLYVRLDDRLVRLNPNSRQLEAINSPEITGDPVLVPESALRAECVDGTFELYLSGRGTMTLNEPSIIGGCDPFSVHFDRWGRIDIKEYSDASVLRGGVLVGGATELLDFLVTPDGFRAAVVMKDGSHRLIAGLRVYLGQHWISQFYKPPPFIDAPAGTQFDLTQTAVFDDQVYAVAKLPRKGRQWVVMSSDVKLPQYGDPSHRIWRLRVNDEGALRWTSRLNRAIIDHTAYVER